MKLLSVLAITLSLVGCATSNLNGKYSLQEAGAGGHGVVVGSLSIATYDSVYPAYITYFINPVDPKDKQGATLKVSTGCDTIREGDSDFLDVCAHLFAIDLPAGDYVVTRWVMENDPGGHFYPAPAWVPARFTVEAGKATYIGDLHMGVLTFPNLPGVHGGWLFVHDQSARDIPQLRQEYPTLGDADVAVAPVAVAPEPIGWPDLDTPSPRAPRRIPKHKP